jgi:hypothetical protein
LAPDLHAAVGFQTFRDWPTCCRKR